MFTASIITLNTATFVSRSIVQPPAGSSLPATSISNFVFYINGQYANNNNVVSFNQVSTDLVLTLNTGSLGFSLQSDEEVVVIGKIQ